MSGESALRREVTVMLPNGLHLRPISLIARAVEGFSCEVTVKKGERTANARNVLDLMALNAGHKERLIVEATGADAAAALDAVLPFFEQALDGNASGAT